MDWSILILKTLPYNLSDIVAIAFTGYISLLISLLISFLNIHFFLNISLN